MANAKAIILTDEDYEYLQSLTHQRTIQAQLVERAKILIYKAQGDANQTIADRLDTNINTVKLCLNKYKSGGIQEAIFDIQRKGRPVEITDDSVSWIINICLPASGRFGIFPGTLDTEKPARPCPKPCGRSRFSTAFYHNKTDGTENTFKERVETI